MSTLVPAESPSALLRRAAARLEELLTAYPRGPLRLEYRHRRGTTALVQVDLYGPPPAGSNVPPPSAADAAGIQVPPDVPDLSGAISHLAAEATLRTAVTTEAALVAHLGTHTMLEFVTELERLHAEIRRLTPAPSDPGSSR